MIINKTIYPKEELEKMANGINDEFFPERLQNLYFLDPYDLVDKFECGVEYKYISPNCDILGMTFFSNSYWYIWPEAYLAPGITPSREYFQKGNIVINQVLLDKKSKEKENFVVTHEISHWIKDKDFFSKQSSDGQFHICKQNDFGKTTWSSKMSTLEIIERQTNYLAAAILMPRESLKKEFFKLCRYKNIPTQPIEYKSFMKRQIGQIAKILNLNFNPVLYRLYDIGVLSRK